MTPETAVIRKALAAVCGEVRDEDPANGTFAAAPGSTEEAAAVMRVAAEHDLAVVVRGGGSRLSWGTPASRCDLVIDMSRMAEVVEHAAGDLVARVQAGARMGDVAAVLAQAGQEIALDVPDDASIGGVVASGLAGPRRLRYGTPRDLLIGITIVRADGTVAKSGGKVVKNVAGYDLGKLFAGSAGTLGLITEATFRLHPLPAARAYVTAEYVAVSVACNAVAAAANSPLVSSAVELSRPEPGGPVRVGVLLEGSVDGVAARLGADGRPARHRRGVRRAARLVAGRAAGRVRRDASPGFLLGFRARPGARRDRGGEPRRQACRRRLRARPARACCTRWCQERRRPRLRRPGRRRVLGQRRPGRRSSPPRCAMRSPESGAASWCSPRPPGYGRDLRVAAG